ILHEQTKGQTDYIWGNLWAFAYPNFVDCQRNSHSLALMAAWRWIRGTVSGSGEAEHVDGIQMSSELFPVLGITPVQGRSFLPEEDHPGSAPVILLGYSLWQRRYGGSTAVIGTPLVLDGKPYTVVGIAPPDLRLFGNEVDVFAALGQHADPAMQSRK